MTGRGYEDGDEGDNRFEDVREGRIGCEEDKSVMAKGRETLE